MFLYDSYTFYFSKQTFRTSIKLCCSLEQVGKAFTPQNVAALRFAGNPDAPRRDKHTPCIKTNRLKRQNRSRAERAVRAKPLANRARFSRTSAMRFFVLFFIGGFFLFLYQVAKSAFCLFGVGIAARVYLNMRFPIQIPTQHSFF